MAALTDGVPSAVPERRAPGTRVLAAAAALAVMALQTWLSSRPMPEVPTLDWIGSDKLLHASAWAVVAALWTWTAARPTATAAAIAFAVALAFGAADELHQSFVPGRDASALDLVADAVGAGAGVAIATWYARRRWRSSTASAASDLGSPPTSSSPITSR